MSFPVPGAESPASSSSIVAIPAEQIEERTRQLRAMDHRFGGGSCLDAVLTFIYRAQGEPRRDGFTDERHHTAMADLHSLAGWACFDIGLVNRAHLEFAQALILAGRGLGNSLVANILYRLGRIRLHHGNPVGALDFFQAGQRASGVGCERDSSILMMNEAWAHAAMGAETQARVMVERGVEKFDASGPNVPAWAGFYTRNDLLAMVGTVHTELAHRVDPRHVRVAIPVLAKASEGYGDDMARSRAFSLIMLSMNHFVDGDVDQGVAVGMRAVSAAADLSSVRVRDRMHPLRKDAERHGSHAGARELVARIAAVTS